MGAPYAPSSVVVSGYPVKRNKTHFIDSWGFDSLGFLNFTTVSPGANTLITAIQARTIFAQAVKVAKVAVYFTAIDNITQNAINVVFGSGAENGTTAPFDSTRTFGYPTQVAVAPTQLFDQDLVLNATNFPNISTGSGSGGVVTFAPFNYDGVYIPTDIFTLRAKTIASTGSITNLIVGLCLAPIDTNCAFNEGGMPTQDF